MAKKRGMKSPLGSTQGAAAAQASSSKETLNTLTNKIHEELKHQNSNVSDFIQSAFGDVSISDPVQWKLKSGITATFVETELSYEQVKLDTFIDFEINGRAQDCLTDESLSDLSSLKFQQFFPVVGRRVKDKIEFLDGSRRRARYLKDAIPDKRLKILLTEDMISVDDAKALAKDIQSAKQHNLYEIGLRCELLLKSNPALSQAEVAKNIGISQSYVSKALKAGSVPKPLISLFPDVNLLKYPDYELLNKLAIKYSITELTQLADNASLNNLSTSKNDSKTDDVENYTDLLIAQLKLKLKEAKPILSKAFVAPLASFPTKGVFARKKINGRNFSYEFGRLSKELQDDLDKAINQVLNNHNIS